MTPKIGEIWIHHKTRGKYRILHIAKLQVKSDSLDMAECVVYQSLTDNMIWVRPVDDFIELIIKEGVSYPRFSKQVQSH